MDEHTVVVVRQLRQDSIEWIFLYSTFLSIYCLFYYYWDLHIFFDRSVIDTEKNNWSPSTSPIRPQSPSPSPLSAPNLPPSPYVSSARSRSVSRSSSSASDNSSQRRTNDDFGHLPYTHEENLLLIEYLLSKKDRLKNGEKIKWLWRDAVIFLKERGNYDRSEKSVLRRGKYMCAKRIKYLMNNYGLSKEDATILHNAWGNSSKKKKTKKT